MIPITKINKLENVARLIKIKREYNYELRLLEKYEEEYDALRKATKGKFVSRMAPTLYHMIWKQKKRLRMIDGKRCIDFNK